MKREKFNIKFKNLITSGKARLTINDFPVRVICWDRKGVYPNIGLIDFKKLGSGETIIEFNNNGEIHIPNECSISSDLYVEYDPIGITKRERVAYSLLKAPCIEIYMRKYGYKQDKTLSYYWDAVKFVREYVKSHMDELHADLKENKDWYYDDDYDWE